MPGGPVGLGGGAALVTNYAVPGLLWPAVLLATTRTVYVVCGVRFVYETLVLVVVRELLLFRVTVYVIGQVEVDAVQLIVAVADPTLLATMFVGTDGTEHGGLVVNDPVPGLLVPPPLTALTWMVYVVPGLRPVYCTLVPSTCLSEPPFRVTV